MSTLNRNTLIFFSVILVAGLGIGAYFFVKKRKQQGFRKEIDGLLELAKKESKVSDAQVERMRFVFNIENYKLPKPLQDALNSVMPDIIKARQTLKSGDYAGFWREVEAILNKLKEPEKSEIFNAFQLTRQTLSKLHTYETDAKSLAEKAGALTNAALFALALPLDRISLSVFNIQQSVLDRIKKDSVPGKVFSDLYTNDKYSKNTLKIFNELWKVYSGNYFFNINTSI